MSGTPRTDAIGNKWIPAFGTAIVNNEETRELYAHARNLERELAAVTAERDALRVRLLGAADLFEASANGADAVGFDVLSTVYRRSAVRCRAGIAASDRIQADMARGLDMVEKAMEAGAKDGAGQ
jgi:hypothetical protein